MEGTVAGGSCDHPDENRQTAHQRYFAKMLLAVIRVIDQAKHYGKRTHNSNGYRRCGCGYQTIENQSQFQHETFASYPSRAVPQGPSEFMLWMVQPASGKGLDGLLSTNREYDWPIFHACLDQSSKNK
ncbi:hypothetical protein [Rhodanobacter hydrolyticus]|uniref:hypothetical protein n=1 Tax=Rhodanobacter hydrolyticus TaxID=2250595 RepID=UPI00384F27A0